MTARRGAARVALARAAVVALALPIALPAFPAMGGPIMARPGKKHASARSREQAGERRAPPITGARWINGKPLRPADYEGKPRLVDFWTFGCINCERTVPAIREIEYRYAKRGLVMVGIHTPEFAHERDSAAVAGAARRFGLTFPIALDNDYAIWKAYKNRYWPALYLVDRRGIIRATHIGELQVDTRAFANFTSSIETLLKEPAPRRAARTPRSG